MKDDVTERSAGGPQHTPGPWVVQRFVKVIAGQPDQPLMVIASGEDIVADVHRERDASLIAAVPDLLAALKLARDELNGLPRSLGYDFTHLPKIDAAIAKALGSERS